MREWYAGEPGRELLETESALLASILPNLFGYHLLQVGAMTDADLLDSSRIHHRIVLERLPRSEQSRHSPLLADPTALPIASRSIDVVLLHHALEFERDPHQVLREAERALIPEGHLVIHCFNPGSLWGLRRLFGWREAPPWCGHFFTLTRIRDWLALLGFDVVLTRGYFFRPPLKRAGLMARLHFLERAGERIWPLLGAAYVVVARKRVAAMTPIRPRWRRERVLAAGRLEPTIRRSRT